MLAMIRSSAGCLLNIINATLDNAAVSTGTLALSHYKVRPQAPCARPPLPHLVPWTVIDARRSHAIDARWP
jgi:hypothetical protein